MGVPINESIESKELLCQLLEVLAPFSPELLEGKEGRALSFRSHLFIPPTPLEKEPLFRRSVTLLSTLRQAQNTMEGWEEGSPPKDPKEVSPEKRPSHAPKLSFKMFDQRVDLAVSVRQAVSFIGSLSFSRNLSPKDLVKKLKPLIENLIETLERTEASPTKEGRDFEKKRGSLKEKTTVQEKISFLFVTKEVPLRPKSLVIEKRPKDSIFPFKMGKGKKDLFPVREERSIRKEVDRSKKPEHGEPKVRSEEKTVSFRSLFPSLHPVDFKQEGKEPIFSKAPLAPDRISPSMAPLFSPSFSQVSPRKKKKKKRFWEPAEEEEGKSGS